MKMKLVIVSLMVLFCITSSYAQSTNTISATNTLISAPDPQSWELTLGGSGVTVPKTGQNQFGLDSSIETNPIKQLRSLWFGFEQGVAWQSGFAGSSDVLTEWSFHLGGNLYLNTGWTAGAVYDTSSAAILRTGPEANLQYFVGSSAFIYSGVNYHFVSRGGGDFAPSLGIGLTFN